MGLTIILEDEDGKKIASVEDPTNILHHALPGPEDAQYSLANTIDWYGDTTFNRGQAELLRKEWVRLVQRSVDEITKTFLERVDDLLERCASSVHLYVKFYGD